MPIALIVQLLTVLGPPAITLIDGLITKWSTNGAVTPEEWALLSAALKVSASDHMKAQLTAAGIDPTSPQGLIMLGLAK
jgi:hypothetical protein